MPATRTGGHRTRSRVRKTGGISPARRLSVVSGDARQSLADAARLLHHQAALGQVQGDPIPAQGDLGIAGDDQPPDYRGYRAYYDHALAEMAGALAAVRIRLRQYSASGARAQGILAEMSPAGYILMMCLRSRERGAPAGAGPA